MKVPKIFLPEKNTEKNLEKILSKKFYTLDKEGNNIKVYNFNGELLDSTKTGERMNDLETFTFHNKKMLTAKFGECDRIVLDERLNPIIVTPSYPNQSYCVFERKNRPSLLMVNTNAKRTKDTRIAYYELDGTKFCDFYHEIHDTLTNKAFVVKTKEQNYLALCFNYHTLLMYEDLHAMHTLKTEPNVNDVYTINMKGEEKIIALCIKDDGPSYQVLRIFDNKFNRLGELNTKDFKPTLPTDDPWHDKLIGLKTFKFGSKDYFFTLIQRKTIQEDLVVDLRVLNTDFEAVLNIPNIYYTRIKIAEHNGRECFFVPEKLTSKLNVYSENLSLVDQIYLGDKFFVTPLKEGYKVVNLGKDSYVMNLDNNILKFYSDFPQDPHSWNNRKPNKKLEFSKDEDLKLKDVKHFEYTGRDFLALEYWNRDGIDIYDNDLKFVRRLPGGDLCIA